MPFFLFILLYIWLDPFCVIHNQQSPGSLHWNRDVQGSRLFVKNYPIYHYKSFILGNSKTLGFRSRDWGKYINDSIPYHWDASSENIEGIYSKLKYLDNIKDSLKNVMIVTDPAVYIGASNEGRFGYNHDYKIDGSSPLSFHFTFFKGFYTDFFYVSYIDYLIFKTYRPYMKNTIPGDWSQYIFDPVTNDFILQKRINSITRDSIGFYSNSKMFYDRGNNVTTHWECIDESTMSKLKSMRNIFDRHHTNYKIVISPLYSQQYFNKADLKKLQGIFGEDNVFDFSGKNAYTANKGNFYDNIHYKPFLGSQLLKKMYGNNKS